MSDKNMRFYMSVQYWSFKHMVYKPLSLTPSLCSYSSVVTCTNLQYPSNHSTLHVWSISDCSTSLCKLPNLNVFALNFLLMFKTCNRPKTQNKTHKNNKYLISIVHQSTANIVCPHTPTLPCQKFVKWHKNNDKSLRVQLASASAGMPSRRLDLWHLGRGEGRSDLWARCYRQSRRIRILHILAERGSRKFSLSLHSSFHNLILDQIF